MFSQQMRGDWLILPGTIFLAIFLGQLPANVRVQGKRTTGAPASTGGPSFLGKNHRAACRSPTSTSPHNPQKPIFFRAFDWTVSTMRSYRFFIGGAMGCQPSQAARSSFGSRLLSINFPRCPGSLFAVSPFLSSGQPTFPFRSPASSDASDLGKARAWAADLRGAGMFDRQFQTTHETLRGPRPVGSGSFFITLWPGFRESGRPVLSRPRSAFRRHLAPVCP